MQTTSPTCLPQPSTQQLPGFSLLELMVVMVIVGILVSLAIPAYQQYTRRAHYTEVVQNAAPLKLAVATCFQLEGSLRPCVSGSAGIPAAIERPPPSLVAKAWVGARGTLHLVPNPLYGIARHDDLVMTPRVVGDLLVWDLGGGAVAAGYVNRPVR